MFVGLVAYGTVLTCCVKTFQVLKLRFGSDSKVSKTR
jgi:hypothetical protein